jgi:hypothetical protein
MKTNQCARQIRKLQIWAGMLAVLLLVSGEFWMVFRLGHKCGQFNMQSALPAPALSDLLAAR